MALLSISDLEIVVGSKSSGRGQRVLCEGFSLQIQAGDRYGLLGPNGSGKTSLLNCLLGMNQPAKGTISLLSRELGQWPSRKLAQSLGMLFQEQNDTMPATVLETVLLGRHPHASHWLFEQTEDISLARQSLEQLGLSALESRDIRSLSGGERQRLAIASLLCQDPSLYLLDEPSNHLDLAFQVKALQLLVERTKEKEAALIMATHDINLAARFCNKILLMTGDSQIVAGGLKEVLSEERLSQAFNHPVRAINTDAGPYFFPA